MQKTCANLRCGQSFPVGEDDLEFYEKISPEFGGKKYLIPPPTLCPECRFQRRMIWRRERSLKNRSCDSCKKSIISMHTADAPYPVYCLPCWWSDSFDPLEYGQEVDLDRPFADQFIELMQRVPQITMMNDNGIGSENCEYCHDFAAGKNCYLIMGAWELQDCYYCDCNCLRSRHLFDCSGIHFSELVYDSLSSQHLYRCIGLDHCDNCNDCWFGGDLKGCKDCLGCFGLRQKRFCIFNEQYDEEDYRQKLASFRLDTVAGYQEFRKKYEDWILRFPRKCVHLVNSENCTGDDLFNCKDTVMSFQEDGAEYCKFVVHGDAPKNCYDVSQNGRGSWCYEGCTPDNSYMTHFTTWCWHDKYVLYSDNCHHCEHLLGCISLKRKKYCILNKQYTKEEYEALAGKIIEQMMATPYQSPAGSGTGQVDGAAMNPNAVSGSWGEFLPMTMSPYCYNETAAQEYFPLSKEDVLARGVQWRDHDRSYAAQTFPVPEAIGDVPETIVDAVLACLDCKRNFKILKQEFDFYRDLGIPIPQHCYECRWRERVKRRNPRKLWERECAKCQKAIQTSYSPERPEIVYCESCYLAEVY